ncbi:sucrose transporter, GPH family [Galdieria sulphuraria]|uniref:Sucrose transporter, GPH family n=1 Tax=Galdieria sulphuraria TaxID=130081 RepID=M2W7L8_GALSU|nr:sucrose transporter, GPH family [Galdieria sulphuraria]EME31816.1 sucrose transporter, GPH family [Galdieria sulphuraria]|eukprot:XP_005708336.1 sucrose transporter, GPH family [Galdieria sulphuraria]
MKNLNKDLFKVEERTEQLDNNSSSEDEETLQPLTLRRLLLLTICTAGQAFSWACQFTYMTPHFLELGLEKEWANFLWVAGPISGLIVQPTIGAYSDRCTSRFGRRRPFLFAGMLCMVCGLLLVANSKNIGKLFGDSSRSAPRGALVISIIGFWIIDLSNNAIQAPGRTLLADLAPPEQQELANALTSFWMGVGNLGGYVVGGFPAIYSWIPLGWSDLNSVFIIAVAVLVPTCLTTLLCANEKPLAKDPLEFMGDSGRRQSIDTGKRPTVLTEILRAFADMPKPMEGVMYVQFFSWIAFFAFQINASSWMGENIFGGKPTAYPEYSEEAFKRLHAFEAGVKAFSLSMAVQSVVSLLFSALLPVVIGLTSLRAVYLFTQIDLAMTLLVAVGITYLPVTWRKIFAMLLVSSTGIPWAATLSLPYAIVARLADPDAKGLFLGVLNIFIVIPQLLVALSVGAVLKMFGGNLNAALVLGGFSAILAAFFVVNLTLPKEIETEEEDEERQEEEKEEDEQVEDRYRTVRSRVRSKAGLGGGRSGFSEPTLEEENVPLLVPRSRSRIRTSPSEVFLPTYGAIPGYGIFYGFGSKRFQATMRRVRSSEGPLMRVTSASSGLRIPKIRRVQSEARTPLNCYTGIDKTEK